MEKRNFPRKRKNNNKKKNNGFKIQTIQRFSKQPEQYKVSLVARDYDSGSSIASPMWYRYGLLEPLGRLPQYLATLFTMYRKARIVYSSLSVKLVNTGSSEPIELVVGTMPFNWVSGSPTISELIGKVGTRRQIASAAGGLDRCSITRGIASKTVLGHEYMLADYDFSLAQASSFTPIDAEEPVWTFTATALNSAAQIDYRLEVVINYDIEFFDLYTS